MQVLVKFFITPGNIVTLEIDEWQHVLNVNLTGHFCVVRYFLPLFIGKRYGRIVHISSLAKNGSSGLAAYGASKAGLASFAQTVAKEYGKKGITSNVIVPGLINTDMTKDDPKKFTEFLLKYSPIKRLGSVDEIASTILFLCSKDASYINGTTVDVTGGIDWVY